MKLRSVLLGARRLAATLPAPVRTFLARYDRPGLRPEPPVIRGWEAPALTGAAGGASAPIPEPIPEPVPVAPDEARPTSRIGGGRSLRCLLVSESVDAGGMDEVVGFLARELPKLGIVTAVMHAPAVPDRGFGRLARSLQDAGVETVSPAPQDLVDWVKAWHPDVVSSHGAPDAVVEAIAGLGVPIVDTLHGMHTLFDADEALVRSRRSHLAGIVSVSDLVREQYLMRDPLCPTADVVTIPNGVDRARLRRYTRDWARRFLGLEDEYLYVSLARHCLQKNTYGLAAAFEDVAAARPDAHLLICGRPDDLEYAGQVIELRRSMRHGDRLHLRDHFARPGLLLAAADAFVLDSFFEGWALASMEALAAGVPIVVSEVGGAREQVQSAGSAGMLVANPLGDPNGIGWDAIGRARFRHQLNHDELVVAMRAQRVPSDARRTAVSAAALRDFDDRLCLRRHAAALGAAASGRALGTAVAFGFGDLGATPPAEAERGGDRR